MTPPDLTEASTLPLLDAAATIRDMDDDIEGYREVAATFLEELTPTIEALSREAARGLPAIVPVLHEAANSMSIVGAQRGAAIVRQLESDIHQGVQLDVSEVRAVCELCLRHSADRLQKFLTDGR